RVLFRSHFNPLFKHAERGKLVVAAGHPVESQKVHREEHQVSGYECQPEVQVSRALAHQASVHFGEPMVNSGEHTEDRSATHHQVEVCNYKIGVVKVAIWGRVPNPDSGKPS